MTSFTTVSGHGFGLAFRVRQGHRDQEGCSGSTSSSSSSIHRAATASDGILQSPHETLCVPWGPGYLKSSGGVNPPCGKVFAIGENAWARHSARARCRGPRRLGKSYCNSSSSAIHKAATASLGIRQSPRGDRVTEPTLGPSGRQERLNCWEKNRR